MNVNRKIERKNVCRNTLYILCLEILEGNLDKTFSLLPNSMEYNGADSFSIVLVPKGYPFG